MFKNVIRGLEVLEAYQDRMEISYVPEVYPLNHSPKHPSICYICVWVNDSYVPRTEKAKLETLGWQEEGEGDCWCFYG